MLMNHSLVSTQRLLDESAHTGSPESWVRRQRTFCDMTCKRQTICVF